MHAGDGVADLLALADQGVALVREGLEQAADADFVVVIGALERGHLVGDQSFELGGARERALDAVAHRGDLAADRLADGDDRLARDLFRLGEPHGDAGHRLGDQAQLLRAPDHVGEHDRRTCTGASTKAARPIIAGMPAGALRQHRLQVGQIEERQDHAAQHPGERENRSNQIGRARRPALQGLQDHADRLAVVVGGAARLRLVVGGGRRADALEQVLVGVQAAAMRRPAGAAGSA